MYKKFASLYDSLNGIEFYEQWFTFVQPFLQTSSQILDLGCGSGTLMAMLSNENYSVTGVDLSADMLALAQEKLADATSYHAFYQSDMVEFIDTTKTYDVIISSCDSLNYITTKADIHTTFGHVYDMLETGGYFIFDMHSDYMFETVFPDWSYGDASEDLSVIWNTFTEDANCYEHFLTFYVKMPNGSYERSDEIHRQFKYEKKEILEMLREKGFSVEAVTSDFGDTFEQEGARNFYIARK